MFSVIPDSVHRDVQITVAALLHTVVAKRLITADEWEETLEMCRREYAKALSEAMTQAPSTQPQSDGE